MTQQIERRWTLDDFPFDPHDDGEMTAIHKVLPTSYNIVVDMSTVYRSPGEEPQVLLLRREMDD
jgi:hypothetical protein